jgi:hypothetical protein
LLNEFKSSLVNSETKSRVSSTLIQNVDEYLVRCGIHEPFEKLYLKTSQELLNVDIGHLSALLLISQLPRLQICHTTGKKLIKHQKITLKVSFYNLTSYAARGRERKE